MSADAVLVVLEDTAGRVDRMREATSRPLRCFARARDLLGWLAATEESLGLISLDYHLASRADGTGMDVARVLVQQAPRCPVIVHSSDTTAADAVAELLAGAGWTAECVPFERDSWSEAVERLVAG